jgi:hypothetical protein
MRIVPGKTRVILWNVPCDLSPAYLRFPRMKAYANADQPEEMWTVPPPAQSREGRLYSYPLGFHVQQVIGQYTRVAQQKPIINDGTIRPRSKAPPTTIWTV